MKTLLLTSGGMICSDQILLLIKGPPQKTKIAHIITAAKPFPDAVWMRKDKEKMLELGFDVEDIDIEGKTKTELENILKNKNIIYVQGGDPYYLLKQVKASGFDHVVKDLINRDVIYVGASAGSYIACPTIEMSLWKKPKRKRYGLAGDEAGMNLVPFLIVAHYKPSYNSAIKNGISHTKYQTRILTDRQAILVSGNIVKLVGKGREVKL